MEARKEVRPKARHNSNALRRPRGQPSPFISAREIAERWRCARSSVDRIARRAALRRIYLGGGARGMVRYLREEVEQYEKSRRV